MSVYLKVDLSRLQKKMSALEKKQIPFALAKSLTDTAKEVKKEIVKEMRNVFDRPTPYTLNSLYIDPAVKKKNKFSATVKIKDSAQKGIAPVKYLGAEVEGGERNLKRSEIALQRRGFLSKDRFVVPGRGVRLDRHGNISGSQMVQILSALGAFTESGFTMNRAGKLKKHRNFFVPKPGSKLKPGVWERTRSGIKPILMFVKSPQYRKRLHFYKIAQRVSASKFNRIFKANFIHAMKTAYK